MSAVQKFKRWSGVGALGFLVMEVGWLGLLAVGAPFLMWCLHWLIVAVGEVIALPGLATRDRRAWVHFLTVCTAASFASYGLGLVPLIYDARLTLIHVFALLGFVVWAVICALFLAFMVRLGQVDRRALPGLVDGVVVLGAGLIKDRPGPLLARRVEKGVDVVQKLSIDIPPDQPIPPLVCSGGQGPDEPVTEAFAMARYARDFGRVEPIGDRLVVIEESWASNTRENILNSIDVLTHVLGRPPRRIAVVTSDFHVWRTEKTAARMKERLDEDCQVIVLGALTPSAARPAAIVREFMAHVVELLRVVLRRGTEG